MRKLLNTIASSDDVTPEGEASSDDVYGTAGDDAVRKLLNATASSDDVYGTAGDDAVRKLLNATAASSDDVAVPDAPSVPVTGMDDD